MTDQLEKLPPQNLEAEQSVLGCMMLDATALLDGLETLEASDFYRPAHQDIFMALGELSAHNQPADPITLRDALRRHNKLEDCGDIDYLMALVNSVPTAANMKHYAGIVAKYGESRRVIAACSEVMATCYDLETANASELFAAKALATQKKRTTEWHGIAEGVSAAWSDLEREYHGNSRPGVPYGVPDLVKLTYGVELGDSEFTLIAGRPSSGKTLLLNEIAVNAAEAGNTVLYYSQETSFKKLCRRMIFAKANVDPHVYRHKSWGDPEEELLAFQRLADASGELHNLEPRIQIADISMKTHELVASARRAMLKEEIAVILVDYLQIVGVSRRGGNRNEEVGEITAALKGLTRDLKVPVVAASQLSRPKEDGKKQYRPSMKDLREGGSQEAEADKIIIVDNPTAEGDPHKPRSMRFIVGKAKDGPTGDVPAWFVPIRFVPREEHYDESEDKEDYVNPFGYRPSR